MYTKEEALAKITELVEKFSDQLPAYKKSDYNETLTRKDFIDPFLKRLDGTLITVQVHGKRTAKLFMKIN